MGCRQRERARPLPRLARSAVPGPLQCGRESGGHRGSDLAADLWVVDPGAPLAVFTARGGSGDSVAFSPDGSELLTTGAKAGANYLAFSPNGDRVISGSDDETAQVWTASDGNTVMTLHGHPEGVQAVGWSPDGRVLATGGYDGVIRLWDTSSGRPLHTLTGSQGQIMRVDFSPNSRWIASSSDEDGAIRIWEVGTGRLVDIHQGDLGSTGFRIDLSPDGREIAVAGFTAPFGEGTVETLLYRCEVCAGIDTLISLANSRVTRALTQAERAQFFHE